jgi:hypothetical protein
MANVDAGAPNPAAPPPAVLGDDGEVKLASQWPAARMEAVIRSNGAHSGISVATIQPANGSLSVRHRSRFAKPPLHVAPGEPADSGLLAPFSEDSMAVFAMNPWRGALDPAEPVDALLLEGRLDDAMRANMGARQLLVVGERSVPDSAMRAPAVGLAFELRDPVLAEAQWDGWARRLVESLAARARKPAPELAAVPAGQPRQALVAPLLKEVFADHPLARGMDICWMTISTPNGNWQLLATDRELMNRISSRIGGAVRAPTEGQWHEVGQLRSPAVADHVRSWASEAKAFLPETPEAFTAGVALVADLAGVAELVKWRAKAPEEQVIESEVDVKLRQLAPALAPTTAPVTAPPTAPPAAPPAAPPTAPPATPPATPPAAPPAAPPASPPPPTPPAGGHQ